MPLLKENEGSQPLAIVGFAFEFPQGATSSDSFWQMLCEGRSASTAFPANRVNINNFYHPDESRQSTLPVRGGNFVNEDLDAFDAPFFSISPGEAACMDPQHRRMLETAYHALEDAGIPIEKCSGSDTAVYTGCFTNDYLSVLQQDYETEHRHAAMGVAPSMLANRVSWFFNLKGTSMNLDSACSSSLVALHLACHELRSGSASMALIGGANLVFHPNFMKMMTSFNFLSPDGRSWSFEDRANGYARGEGTVVIVVKRLEDALRDGDTIRVVIRETGSNQDGRTPGITQPSLQSQVDLIERTYRHANISMDPTRFFEAHGTGTLIGDPTEANAIGKAFQSHRTADDPLYIGAVKANIGHLEGASGLAGIVKALLVLENGIIPPIAGFEKLNHRIDDKKLGLHFPKEAIPWPTVGIRRACVNSFGFGGTNAVAILDDAYHYLELCGLRGHHRTRPFPPSIQSDLTSPVYLDKINGIAQSNGEIANNHSSPKLFVWSATEKDTIENMSISYHEWIQQQTTTQIDNLAYTLSEKRSHFPWRDFSIANYGNGFIKTKDVEPKLPVRARKDAQLTFIFTGQGAQYIGMGRELLSFPAFEKSVELLDDCLKQLQCSWSLSQILDHDNKSIPIDRPEYSQPLTTCLQIALVDLLASFGITPAFVIGHSSGEIAAAYAAGGLSRLSAVKVAYYRGSLSSQLADRKHGYSMMAVGILKKKMAPYFTRLMETEGTLDVAIGCVNSPDSITLTGKAEQLDKLHEFFEQDSIFSRRLRIPIAYHSRVMDGVADEYRLLMGKLERGRNSRFIPMISTVTGDFISTERPSNADYWVENLTSTVEFEGALNKLLVQGSKQPRKKLGASNSTHLRVTHLLEVGPHGALKGPVGEIIRSTGLVEKPVYISSLKRNENAAVTLLTAAGKLHCAGLPVDLLSVNGISEEVHLPIPPNMPQYPFNHQQKYWVEGRLSKNFRFRDTPRHDLIGTRTLDWNPQIAQWRNVIRLNELPWLQDHRISDQIVLPAAGMVVMAIEAFQQLAGSTTIFKCIEIKRARFLHAITIAEDAADQLETQLTLSTASQFPENLTWSQFRLFALENGSYIECCRGFIRGAIDQTLPAPSFVSTPDTGLHQWITEIADTCHQSRDPYNELKGSALKYGPTFQNVESLRLGPEGKAYADVNINSWKSNDESDERAQRYTIHPTTMDGMAQIIMPVLSEGRDQLPTMVPVGAKKIWVNCSELSVLQDERIVAAGQCKIRGLRGATADIAATTADHIKPLLVFEGLETAFIDGHQSSGDKEDSSRNLCTRLIWKPDISMTNSKQLLAEVASSRPKPAADEISRYQSMKLAILCFIDEASAYLQNNPSLPIPDYLKVYYCSWMKYQQQVHNSEINSAKMQSLATNKVDRDTLITDVENSGTDGYLFMHIGRNLISVLSGRVDPLDLMFTNGLADRYYEEVIGNDHHAHPACAYVEHLCFKNPSMNILEVGAGTGSISTPILKTLASDGVMKCSQYDYTDISPGFFARAQDKFAQYADVIQFRIYDISQESPLSFQPASYDLVIASHVLHATENLDFSLRNLRKLLKPGGKLLLCETTSPDALHIGFSFGLLKDWWKPLDHESRSLYSPCLTSEQWHDRLTKCGFSGVDVEFPGQEPAQCQYSSIMVSTAISKEEDEVLETSVGGILLVKEYDSRHQNEITNLISRDLPVSICDFADIPQLSIDTSTLVVFLMDIRETFFNGISEARYKILQSVLLGTKNTLWVTQSASKEQSPFHHIAKGFGRTLASEDSTRKFVTLSVDSSYGDEKIAQTISSLIGRIQTSSIDNLETNYIASQDNVLRIPRVCPDQSMSDAVIEKLQTLEQKQCHPEPSNPVVLRIDAHGNPPLLAYYEESSESSSLMQEDEVLITVKAFGLTFQDYLAATGQIDQVDLCTECAGVVLEAGAKTGFRPGDRVCVIGISLARSHVRVRAGNVAAIPSTTSFSEAAALPTALWLAHYSLYKSARLEAGETVVIHQGSSCFGQMAIQLATKRNARVIVTANSVSKQQFLCSEMGIPETHILSSTDSMIGNKICALTNGDGADIVIGSLGDESCPDFSECLAINGRLIDITLKEAAVSVIPASSERRPSNTSSASLNMFYLLQKKPEIVTRGFQEAWSLISKEMLTPPKRLHIFAAGNVEAAFQHFNDRSLLGKRVIELDEQAILKVNCIPRPKYEFQPNASYVIAGGLGGLGRTFARWMTSRGARHLILLSRSGPQTSSAHDLVNELISEGVNVATPKVDISDLAALKKTLADLAEKMPPVRGCIQATAALRDNLFENMTHGDWVTSTNCKIAGSWNLHQALPENMDFFVLMASVNGIFGNRGQANYAAGNTFEDALAHYRIAQGQKAVSIDLGLMVAEGLVAESEFLLTSMRRLGHLMEISQEQLIALLDHFCNPDLPLLSDEDAQVIVGIEMPRTMISKGIELHHSMRRPLFRQLFQIGAAQNSLASSTQSTGGGGAIDRLAALRNAESHYDAITLVTEWLSTRVGQILGLAASDVDQSKPLHTYGIDSLVAVDLKNWFESELGATITVFDLMGNKSLQQLSELAVEKSRHLSKVD